MCPVKNSIQTHSCLLILGGRRSAAARAGNVLRLLFIIYLLLVFISERKTSAQRTHDLLQAGNSSPSCHLREGPVSEQ
jgi:uncharacterized membrane protein YhaH (DUF805 family)